MTNQIEQIKSDGDPDYKKAMMYHSDRADKYMEEVEVLRLQLAACGVAAMCNTEKTIAEQRIGKDNPYYSASYSYVCNAVDREIKLRKFKDYVHKRFDQMGVPADPEPEKNAEHGCRIEGRINFLEKNTKIIAITFAAWLSTLNSTDMCVTTSTGIRELSFDELYDRYLIILEDEAKKGQS
jgi:hypothetical protein